MNETTNGTSYPRELLLYQRELIPQELVAAEEKSSGITNFLFQ